MYPSPPPWCDQSALPFLKVFGHTVTTAESTPRREASSCWAGGKVTCRSLRRLGDMSCEVREVREERAAGGSWVLGVGGACQEGWGMAACFSRALLVSAVMAPSTPMAYASAARRSTTSVSASLLCCSHSGPGWSCRARAQIPKELGEGGHPRSRVKAGLHARVLSSRTCLAALWRLLRPQKG